MDKEDFSTYGFDPGLCRVLERIHEQLNLSHARMYAKALSEQGFLHLNTMRLYTKLDDFHVCVTVYNTNVF